MTINFKTPDIRELKPRILVLGVGGAGGNAINGMIDAGLQGVTDTKEIDGREYPLDGDIILKIDDVVVRKITDILVYLQREKSIGDEMIMTVNRDGTLIEKVLVLGERPLN